MGMQFDADSTYFAYPFCLYSVELESSLGRSRVFGHMSLLYWVEKLSGVKSAWRRVDPSWILEGYVQVEGCIREQDETKPKRNGQSSRVERVEIVISKEQYHQSGQ